MGESCLNCGKAVKENYCGSEVIKKYKL